MIEVVLSKKPELLASIPSRMLLALDVEQR